MCMRETCEAWGAGQHSCSLHKLSKGVKGSGAWRWVHEWGLFCFMLLFGLFILLSHLFQLQYTCQGVGMVLVLVRVFAISMVCIQQNVLANINSMGSYSAFSCSRLFLSPWGRGRSVFLVWVGFVVFFFYLSLDIQLQEGGGNQSCVIAPVPVID